MITPNKFVTFEQSVLSKLPAILKAIKKPTRVSDLFSQCSHHFDGIDEFIYALDTLFVLDQIKLEKLTGEIHLA